MDDFRDDPKIQKWVKPYSVTGTDNNEKPSHLTYDKPAAPEEIEELEFLSSNNTISDYKVEENRFGYEVTIMFNDGNELRIAHDFDGIYLKPSFKRFGHRAKQIGSLVEYEKHKRKTEEENKKGIGKFFDIKNNDHD